MAPEVEVLVHDEARTIHFDWNGGRASVGVQPNAAYDGIILSAYAAGVNGGFVVSLEAGTELVAAMLGSLAACGMRQGEDAGPSQARGHGVVELLRDTDDGDAIADALDASRQEAYEPSVYDGTDGEAA